MPAKYRLNAPLRTLYISRNTNWTFSNKLVSWYHILIFWSLRGSTSSYQFCCLIICLKQPPQFPPWTTTLLLSNTTRQFKTAGQTKQVLVKPLSSYAPQLSSQFSLSAAARRDLFLHGSSTIHHRRYQCGIEETKCFLGYRGWCRPLKKELVSNPFVPLECSSLAMKGPCIPDFTAWTQALASPNPRTC